MPDSLGRKITGKIGEMNKKPKKQSSLETWLRNGKHPKDQRESPRVPDWFLNSNVRKLVRKYIRKRFPADSWSNQYLTDKVIRKFYEKYKDYPTSRRSPLLRLDRLILMPSLETPDMNPICFVNQIFTECFVDMSKNNFYMQCELKAYELIMRKEEGVRNGSDFPTFEKLKAKTIHVYQGNHVRHKQPPIRSENISGMSEIATSSHERETQQNPPSRKKSTAAPLSVLKRRSEEKAKKIEKEKEVTMDEIARNFLDENYELPPEVLKKLRKELRKIRKAEEAAAPKSRRRIREIPPDSETEGDVRCDEDQEETLVFRSPLRKRNRRIVDTPIVERVESPGRKPTGDAQQLRNPDLELSPSYRKMQNLTGASTSTPSRSPGLQLLAAAVVAFSPRATNMNSQRRVLFESPGKQIDVSEELVIPRRDKDKDKKTLKNPCQDRQNSSKSTAAPLSVKLRWTEEERRKETSSDQEKTPLAQETVAMDCETGETPSWVRDFFDDNVAIERQMLSTPLTQETSAMDSEVPAWVRDFFDDNVAYERQMTSNWCDEELCEPESLSEELIGAVISTPALCPDDFIVELPEDSEVAVRGHSAIEERMTGGICEEEIEFPCDRMAESTADETEEKRSDAKILENPSTVQENQAEEDSHVTQDIFQTQVSSNESYGTLEEDEVSLSTDSYQSVENIGSEREFSADVVMDKLAAEEIAKDLEISTDKMSENEINEVALPLLTCLYRLLPDDDVVFVGRVDPVYVFVEDLTQNTNLTQMSQDPLVQEMSEIFGL